MPWIIACQYSYEIMLPETHYQSVVNIKNGADVNLKNNEEKTPLKLAIENGHNEIADLLRKHGAVE